MLLTQGFELLPGELLRCHRIGGLLKEEAVGPREKGIGGGVEGIEILTKTQHVELITPLLEGLSQRHPDAASLVAQQA